MQSAPSFFSLKKETTYRKVPFVLLTNGGGVTEEAKAQQISNMLDVEVRY